MKIKLAQFREVNGDWTSFATEDDYQVRSDGYVQISEFIEVDFPEKESSQQDYIDASLADLEKRQKTATAEYQNLLTTLERKKAELLCIPHIVETAA